MIKIKPPDPGQVRARARALRPELAEATDALNKSLQEAESYLTGLKLNVRAAVPLIDEPGSPEFTNLVHGKLNEQWCMYIEEGNALNDEDSVVIPIMNATRRLRMMVADKLEALLAQMVRVANAEVELVRQKSRQIQDFISRDKGDLFDGLAAQWKAEDQAHAEAQALLDKQTAGGQLTPEEQAKVDTLFAPLEPEQLPQNAVDQATLAREAIEKGNREIQAMAAGLSGPKKKITYTEVLRMKEKGTVKK